MSSEEKSHEVLWPIAHDSWLIAKHKKPSTRRPITLEVCVDSLASAQAALDGGADRLEMCAGLALGGLTPTPALVEQVAGLSLPVHALIRCRAGDFQFSAAEVQVMRREIQDARAAGAAGVVIGALDEQWQLDERAFETWLAEAQDLHVTCHRAFDFTPDVNRSLNTLMNWGVGRVLTAGQAPNVTSGLSTLRQLVEQSAGRISILAGGGINAQNVAEVVTQTGVCEVHGSLSQAVAPSHQAQTLSHKLQFDLMQRQTSAQEVAAVRHILQSLAGETT